LRVCIKWARINVKKILSGEKPVVIGKKTAGFACFIIGFCKLAQEIKKYSHLREKYQLSLTGCWYMEFDENCTDSSSTLSEGGVKEFFLPAPSPLIWRGMF
jgi:hypothetical protein